MGKGGIASPNRAEGGKKFPAGDRGGIQDAVGFVDLKTGKKSAYERESQQSREDEEPEKGESVGATPGRSFGESGSTGFPGKEPGGGKGGTSERQGFEPYKKDGAENREGEGEEDGAGRRRRIGRGLFGRRDREVPGKSRSEGPPSEGLKGQAEEPTGFPTGPIIRTDDEGYGAEEEKGPFQRKQGIRGRNRWERRRENRGELVAPGALSTRLG